MKTAISLPDEIFEAGEQLAAALRMSRSQLYATALAEFLAKHRDDGVTSALDRVYGANDAPGDEALRDVTHRTLRRTTWE